ncbi:hypothetical protein ACA910_020829 [Epithemia clementina (nom. ined.)]
MISLMIDQQVQDLQSYKRGKTRYDLPTVILAKLHLITIWALNQMAATKTFVPASLWMKLTNNEFDQWCIASNYELPVDDAILVTPASIKVTSTFFDITDDYEDWNLALLFELPADDERTSMFADIADNFDNWNLASIFELPFDEADMLPSSDPHFHAQNNTSVNPPDAYGLSHTSVHLSAQHGEQFNACNIKIIGDPDKDTKKTFVGTDTLDKETKRKIGGTNNQEITVLPLMVHLNDTSHCSLVDKSWIPYFHGENALTDLFTTKSEPPKEHNTANTVMINQPSLSPLCGQHYNMAQQRLHHVASLTNQGKNPHRSLTVSSISSDAHLGKTSSAPSYDVTAHCNQDYLPDFPTYHTKAQASIRSEYFDAFSQLTYLIATKKPVNKIVTCLHGETKHDHHSICMEMLHVKNAPNTASENSTPKQLMHHSPSLHPPDLCAPFRIFAISKLRFVPYKVTLDNHLGNYVHFHHTQEFSPTNLADDDPTSIHPKSVFFHSPADDDPTQSLLSTWPLIPYLLDASITFCPTLWDTSTSTPTTFGPHLLTCCADPSVGEIQLTSFLMDCKSDGTEESPPKSFQVLVNLFIWHHYEDMFKVLLFVAHQDHQVLLEWETGESTYAQFTTLQFETTANASMSSLFIPLKILVSTMSSSGATQSCQDLSNFHKNMKWGTLTLETFKDAQYFRTLWHAWKTDKVHDQWELGQVLNASSAEYRLNSAMITVGHHLNRESTYVSGLWGVGIDNMQLSGLVHFHKSEDPHAIWLFDEGPTARPKLVDDMEMCDPWHGTPHQFLLLLQDQVPDLCCVKVLDTKDSSVHQHDFQDQAIGSGVALLESKEPISVTVHNNPKRQVGYQIQDHKGAEDDTSKSYGKVCWAIGTVALTYLVIELLVHGHLTKDHFLIATFLSEFNNLGLWGAAIGNANLLKILLSATIISPTQSKEWIMSLFENVIPITIGNNLWGNITNIPLFDDDGIFMAPHDWGGHQVQYHYLDWIPHESHLWHQATHVTAYLLAIFMSLVDWGDTYPFSPHLSHPHHLPLYHHVHQVITPALTKWFICKQKKTNIVCIPTKFCTFEAVWVTLKNFYHLCLSLFDNATTITIGNNLWGNITNMYLFDVDGIFMTYHDWGDYIPRNHFFDFVIHEFNLWYKTAHIVQRCAYLLGIFMSLVDWGDIYSFSLCQSNLYYPFFHHHVHQVIVPVKWFTVSQLQHKTDTADTLNRFIWYVRDILPFWHEFQDSTKSTQPTHHAMWGVIHFPPYGVKVVVAMRVV